MAESAALDLQRAFKAARCLRTPPGHMPTLKCMRTPVSGKVSLGSRPASGTADARSSFAGFSFGHGFLRAVRMLLRLRQGAGRGKIQRDGALWKKRFRCSTGCCEALRSHAAVLAGAKTGALPKMLNAPRIQTVVNSKKTPQAKEFVWAYQLAASGITRSSPTRPVWCTRLTPRLPECPCQRRRPLGNFPRPFEFGKNFVDCGHSRFMKRRGRRLQV